MKLKKLASLALAGALTLGLLLAFSSPALATGGDTNTYTIDIPSALTVTKTGWNDQTGDKLASEAVSITVPVVLHINELVGPYTGDKLTCEYYAGETWQALVDRYDLIKVYSGRAAFGGDGFIYDESGSAVSVTALVDNTKTYEVQ